MARHLIQSATTGDARIVGDAALAFFPGYAIVDTYDDGVPPAVFYGAGESDLRYVNVTELSDPASAASVTLRAAFGPSLPAQEYAKWRLALGKVRAGTADAKLLVIGDSTSAGSGSANASSPPLTSWPAKLATLLNSHYIPTQLGLGVAPRVSLPTFDSRWTAGTGWSAAQGGFDGNAAWLSNGPTSGSLVFTPGATAGTYDTFDVYYMGVGSEVSLQLTATGGATQTIAVNGNGVFPITVPAGAAGTSNSVSVTVINGSPLWVVGVEPYLSTSKKVRIGNGAVPGGSAGGAGDPGTYGAVDALKAYAPDLTIIMEGINDAAGSDTTTAFAANMQRIIDAAKLSGDVALATFIPSHDDGTLGANQATILPVLRQLAATNSLGLIDLNARWVSYDVSNPLGYYADVVHGSDLGYWDIAHFMYRTLLSI